MAPNLKGTTMARQTRDEKKAARQAAAQHFAAWLDPLMRARGLGPTEVAARARKVGGTFHKGTVSHWAAGDGAPDAINTLIIARIFECDPVEALRAAGHHTIADQIDALVYEAIHSERILADAKEIAETSDGRDVV